ncbi:MAG: DUF2804 domain-containing protein [Clostridia bacterium]|nr:DUF2804 domain-containing protein [Clostridia bacterium]
MQHEIVKPTDLLDEQGNIAEPGYAKKLLYNYNRENITAKKSRIKEWDYYYISDKEKALCLTIADMGYVGGLSISVIDFVKPSQITNSSVFFFPMGKLNMPRTSAIGDCSWKNGKVEMSFSNDGNVRRLKGIYPNADKKGTSVSWDIVISEAPEESMVIATPFDKKGYFYLNQKINCMKAQGYFTLGGEIKEFSPIDSLATLDWGRGVWTYDNTWYWGSLHTRFDDGKTFGWNIGYGFGNTESASEDMLFYDGKAHKIERTEFVIPGDKEGKPRYMEEWKFVSQDGRLDCTFTPIIDRYAPFDLKIMCMIPHQVFGYISGKCILDDGKEIMLDKVLGFAEKVHNKW